MLSHLDRLKYLDYALIDKTEVTLAREQYQDELEEYKEKKMLSDAARKREMELASASTVLEQANVLIIEVRVEIFQNMMIIFELELVC